MQEGQCTSGDTIEEYDSPSPFNHLVLVTGYTERGGALLHLPVNKELLMDHNFRTQFFLIFQAVHDHTRFKLIKDKYVLHHSVYVLPQ